MASSRRADRALELVRERYARGEISGDEFDRMRQDLRCAVNLTDRQSGKPVEGASLVLTADMPSVPLVHSVRLATAAPGRAPGTYQGVIQLEMAGRWVIGIRVTDPVSDAFTHNLDVSTPPG